jgi:hypothetical protein
LVNKKRIVIGKRGKKFFLQQTRKVNLGPDGKRKILADGIHTRPFVNKSEAGGERSVLENMTTNTIRKSTDNVVLYLKKNQLRKEGKKEIRIHSSRNETIIRVIVTLILQEKLNKQTYSELANTINSNYVFFGLKERTKINETDLKN